MEQDKFYLNIEESKIYKGKHLIAETQILNNNYSAIEIEKLALNNATINFLCDYRTEKRANLFKLTEGLSKQEWESTYINNLCLEEEGCYLEDFPKGYFFFVDVWKSLQGEIILIFYRNH